jgi:hypothetical protein
MIRCGDLQTNLQHEKNGNDGLVELSFRACALLDAIFRSIFRACPAAQLLEASYSMQCQEHEHYEPGTCSISTLLPARILVNVTLLNLAADTTLGPIPWTLNLGNTRGHFWTLWEYERCSFGSTDQQTL